MIRGGVLKTNSGASQGGMCNVIAFSDSTNSTTLTHIVAVGVFISFGASQVLCLVLVGLYCLWLLYLISRSLAEINGFRVQFRFIGILTGLTIVISGFGIAFGALSPLPVSRGE